MTVFHSFHIRCRSKLFRSNCNSSRYMSYGNVRVRFAPSPTGFMHLGSLRTALYNYLFAKKFNGQFILRIEDTDQTRIVEASVQSIINTLEWVGLRYDIGPIYQSSRLKLYNEKAAELLEKEVAYRCFCTEHRLDLLRKEAVKNREKIRYDRRCYHLSQKEINEKLGENVPFAIRFKLENEVTTFNDLIFGRHTKNVFESQSDPILLKSSGYPTYHLANVVDDNDMKVTHVFRGSEWLSSTPLHILIYRAFGWQSPQFAHLPLITNQDGSKLSKRLDSVRIDFLRESGYLPKTLLNYMRSIGGGFDQLNVEEVYDLDKLCKAFKPESIADYPAKLDVDKLNYYSRKVLKEYITENISFLVDTLRLLVKKKYGEKNSTQFSDEYLKFLVSWSQDRIFTLNDLFTDYSFIWTDPSLKEESLTKFSSLSSLVQFVDDICKIIAENCSDPKSVPKLLKDLCENNNIKYNKFMQLIRTALTGLSDGPPIVEIVTILGTEKSCERIRNAAKYIQKMEQYVHSTSISN